jgi:CRISPR-associated protein Csm1
MDDHVLMAALAGLLHDVGKFTGRAAVGTSVDFTRDEQKAVGYRHAEDSGTFVDQYVPEHLRAGGVQAVRFHHRPDHIPSERTDVNVLAHLVRLADQWAAAERQVDAIERMRPTDTPLVPVLSEVELLHKAPQERWWYQLQPLDLERDTIFPTRESTVDAGQYTGLWDNDMRPELDQWKRSSTWNSLSLEAYFVTLNALLRKYLSFVPSATPWQADEDDRVLPDVSLFDHLKVTAAIAACLRAGFNDDELGQLSTASNQSVALLVRGDFSGVQSFIYRITQPEGEATYSKVAKRLRGRSFYLGLLGDVIVDWLMRELGVTPANVLFSGGGRFDILAPINRRAKVDDCEQQLADWLLHEFYGELGIVMACTEVEPDDFGNMRDVYDALDTELAERKRRKWLHQLPQQGFLQPDWKKYHACRVCQITPLADPGICNQCKQHEAIGKKLLHVSHIAFVPGPNQSPKDAVAIPFGRFGTTAVLCDEADAQQLGAALEQSKQSGTIYRLNDTRHILATDASPLVGQTFRFLANAAPIAQAPLSLLDMDPVAKDDVLHFDAIAHLSSGVKRIGILKADVDRLGLIFGLGVHPTISRVAALSSAIDLFFSGWLNRLCDRVFEDWKIKQSERAVNDKDVSPFHDKVTGLFYVMYSGGDDLFIIGPWDETLRLAQCLHDDFTDYACLNPNVTLSAGYVQVKPHYPVQRFAHLVSEAEESAKKGGRNCITVFGETIAWTDGAGGYKELLEFAHALRGSVETNDMPRTLVHDLARLAQVTAKRGDDEKPLFSPQLHYTLTRRLKKEVRDQLLQNDVISKLQHIMFPASYVSLSTRKE